MCLTGHNPIQITRIHIISLLHHPRIWTINGRRKNFKESTRLINLNYFVNILKFYIPNQLSSMKSSRTKNTKCSLLSHNPYDAIFLIIIMPDHVVDTQAYTKLHFASNTDSSGQNYMIQYKLGLSNAPIAQLMTFGQHSRVNYTFPGRPQAHFRSCMPTCGHLVTLRCQMTNLLVYLLHYKT